jgi:amidase
MVVTPDPAGVLRQRDNDGPTDRAADRCARRLSDRRDKRGPGVRGGDRRHSSDTRIGRPPRRRRSPSAAPADDLIAAFTTIWNIGGAGVPLADPDRVEPHNLALRDAARTIDSWAYAEGVRKTQQLSRRIVEGFLASFDLLITPTMACLPPPIGAWRAGTGGNPLMALFNSYPMAMFTTLFNVTGQPAISVPIHHDDATGLPVGVQIVAAPWREDLLLQVSRTLELAHPWTDRRPPVS